MRKSLRCRLGVHCDHMTDYVQFERKNHHGFATYQESETTHTCCRPECRRVKVSKYRPPTNMWLSTICEVEQGEQK